MNPPRISVLMAVHNGLPYLREALDSILSQSRADFEFLIIDDGSTDRSREVIQGLDDSRIRLLVNERNMGLTRSLNRGLKEARGGVSGPSGRGRHLPAPAAGDTGAISGPKPRNRPGGLLRGVHGFRGADRADRLPGAQLRGPGLASAFRQRDPPLRSHVPGWGGFGSGRIRRIPAFCPGLRALVQALPPGRAGPAQGCSAALPPPPGQPLGHQKGGAVPYPGPGSARPTWPGCWGGRWTRPRSRPFTPRARSRAPAGPEQG